MPQIKIALATAWVLSAAAAGVLMQVGSTAGFAVLAALALLPPVAMHVLWHDPSPTMSQRIHQGRD